MLIRFMGPGHHIREIGEVTWGTKAGLVQDVPAEVAAYCLTTPGEQFEIDDAEPLLEYVSKDAAGVLVLEGVGSVAEYLARSGKRGKRSKKGSHGLSATGGLPLHEEVVE